MMREVNTHIAEITAEWRFDRAAFLCECGRPACSETVEVELKELATLHAEDGYCVARGHAVEGVDELVDARPRYDYVRTID